ncbi:spore germination protein GerM [Desulfosporosinus acididurans]|uniref:Spore germination protein GerM n=1 Tax=Desulfosporosinus acididurans TaxID=476652 RepID=A0A0J1FLI5_9FIRM|nr:GerMN domain-containing protein [Desulfosporosinus acididurans]KLU64340.1 spore germination protein GerM [Desulfosporosinus acididurans]
MKIRAGSKLVIGMIVLSLLSLTGCGTLETLINKDGTDSSFGNFIGGDKTAAISAAASALTSTSTSPSADSKVITLYFPDSTGKYLVKEQRTLPKTLSVARETVTEWLKGPAAAKGTKDQAAVPASTTLLDIAVKGDLAVVDLSKEFLQPSSKVTPEAALYGLVNTLTQYSTIKQVQIRIEGKPLTKYGTIDATNLVSKPSLVKGSTPVTSIIPNLGSSAGTDKNNGSSGTSGQSLQPSQSSQPSGTGTSQPNKTDNALPNSPSSINLFNYPPSST